MRLRTVFYTLAAQSLLQLSLPAAQGPTPPCSFVCHADTVSLTADVIGSGSLPEAQDAPAPRIVIVQAVESLPEIVQSLAEEHRAAIAATDFSSSIVAVLVSGSSVSPAMIRWKRGFINQGQLWVTADFERQTGAGTGTYQVVRLRRAELGSAVPASWLLLDQQGSLRATGGVPSSPAAAGLAFETVAHAASGSTEPQRPVVFIAANREAAEPFLAWLRDPDRERVVSNDWSRSVIIAVFHGSVGSSGSSITVRELDAEQKRMRVKVAITSPSPDSMVRPAFESPYHIVSVPKASLAGEVPSLWSLEDTSGKLLAEKR